MTETTMLKWRRHQPSLSKSEALFGLTEQPDDHLQFPELPATAQGKAAALLRVAAQVEHALMVQYLYAAYSFSSFTEPAKEIANVAIEEMSHLMTVQNLLRLIGEAPHLLRQDFEPPADSTERLFPFDLRLEPVSHLSLAKYVVAESPAATPEGVDPAVFAHIVDLAIGSAHQPVNRVGTLYALLGAVFGTEQLLGELAATGDPWYLAVDRLAAEAAEFYGGRDVLHLPDSAFHPDSLAGQDSDEEWDRSVVLTGRDEFRVYDAADRLQALEALRDIGLQGEGPSVVATETAHFRRFYDLFLSFFGSAGTGTNPPPNVLAVPAGSRIVLDENVLGENVISHPLTIRWARLADLRYAILLASLHRYLTMPFEDREFLRGWCFAEMFALKRLADYLRTMPREQGGGSALFGAVPFNLPVWLASGPRWSDLAAAFGESMTIAQGLSAEGGLAADRQTFLTHLLASDERKFEEAKARETDTTRRTRTDAVRDVLDWAAGAGNPGVGHGGQGRFWNLQHDDFVQVEIGGEKVTTPPSPDEDAPMVAMLRSGAMPKRRPRLPETGEEFLLIERWVADGCPE